MADSQAYQPLDSHERELFIDTNDPAPRAQTDRPISESADSAEQHLLSDEVENTTSRSHSLCYSQRTPSVERSRNASTQGGEASSQVHDEPVAITPTTLTNNEAQSPLLDESPPRYSRASQSSTLHTQTNRASRLSKASFYSLKEQITHSFTPAHHVDDDLGTARKFVYWKQGRRVWRLTVGECLLTFIFCAIYGVILRRYEVLLYLDKPSQHLFNTLVTGISLLIGVNLTASLRSYAKVLRWRLLSYCYRPLQNFDLVLGCDSLMNVVRLVWRARNSRHPYLPAWTQVFGVLWLLVNLSMTVFVGMISLNYGLTVSGNTSITTFGKAQIVDMSSILSDDYFRSLSTIQGYGVSGWNNDQEIDDELGWDAATDYTYETLGNGTTAYFFDLFAPNNTGVSILSQYYLRADSLCTAYNVTEGIYGNYSWFVYLDNTNKPINQTYNATLVNPGGLLVMSNINSTCGPKCTNTNVFQAAFTPKSDNGTDFTIATYYTCNTTLSPMMQDNTPAPNTLAPSTIQLSDLVLSMLAGSMGWSDTPLPQDPFMYQVYPQTSQIGFVGNNGVIFNTDVQDLLSTFTMGAIVAMADSQDQGLDLKPVTIEGAPVPAQYLQINWKYVLIMLIGIPVGHLLTLLIVILLANNTIIKDHSNIAIAKLYLSLLRETGFDDRGCLLEGPELIKAMGDPMVAYGWRRTNNRDPEGNIIGHLDVFDEKGSHIMEKGFERDIYYDGEPEAVPLLGMSSQSGSYAQSDEGKRIRRRFDAKEWF